MPERPTIELEVRESTGLGLGFYDLFVIRQRIYEGELKPNAEFLVPGTEGDWRPLAEHPALAEVFWLKGESLSSLEQREKSRSKFGGWQRAGGGGAADVVRLEGDKKKGTGLLGRLFGRRKPND